MTVAAQGATTLAIVTLALLFSCALCSSRLLIAAVPKMPPEALNWNRVAPYDASRWRIGWNWLRFVLMVLGIFSGFLTLPFSSIVSLHYSPIVESDSTLGSLESDWFNSTVANDNARPVSELPKELRGIYNFGQVVLWTDGAEAKYYAMWVLASIYGVPMALSFAIVAVVFVAYAVLIPIKLCAPLEEDKDEISGTLRNAVVACIGCVFGLPFLLVFASLFVVLFIGAGIMIAVMMAVSFLVLYFGLTSTAVSTLLAPLNCIRNANGVLVMAAAPQYICAEEGKDAFLTWMAATGSIAVTILLNLSLMRDTAQVLGVEIADAPDGSRYLKNLPAAYDKFLKSYEQEQSSPDVPVSGEDNLNPLHVLDARKDNDSSILDSKEVTTSPETQSEKLPAKPHPIPPGMVMPWLSMSLTTSTLVIGVIHLLRPDGADETADKATAVLGVILPALIGICTIFFDVATNRIMAVAIQVSLVGVTIINITSLSLFLHEITDVGATTYQWVFVATSILCLVIIVVFAIYHLRNHPVNIPAFILEGKVIVDSSPGHKNRFEDPPTPQEPGIEL